MSLSHNCGFYVMGRDALWTGTEVFGLCFCSCMTEESGHSKKYLKFIQKRGGSVDCVKHLKDFSSRQRSDEDLFVTCHV